MYENKTPETVSDPVVTKINTPQIINYSTEHDSLTFTLKDTDVSIANGLRRTILSDVPTVVFRTFPHERNLANFIINTTQLNNEILKQRLSCIPIHIINDNFNIANLEVILDKKNDTNDIMIITTKDFTIRDIATNKFLTEDVRDTLFPPNKITGDYIIFARLRPKITDELPAEEIAFSATLSYGSAKESGAFNVVSNCTYRFTPDLVRREELIKELFDPDKEIEDGANLESLKTNWLNHDSERIYIPNSFDMTVKSVGVFKNENIVGKACDVIIGKLHSIQKQIQDNNLVINNSLTNIPNAFDITLTNEDYTIGKILEYVLFKNYFQTKQLTFSGFRKNHPHDPDSIIRIAFPDSEIETTKINNIIHEACSVAIKIYSSIKDELLPDM
jgi:DNA-directed RNA polymerase II subunit RPB3